MPTITENIASGLETHREELTAMLEALGKTTMSGLRRAEVTEHMTRARQAVGLAKAVLVEGS